MRKKIDVLIFFITFETESKPEASLTICRSAHNGLIFADET